MSRKTSKTYHCHFIIGIKRHFSTYEGRVMSRKRLHSIHDLESCIGNRQSLYMMSAHQNQVNQG